MKPVTALISFALVSGTASIPASFAHPYEGAPHHAPQVFIRHQAEAGHPVYTNIPKKCFSTGRLTCAQLHPLFKGPGTVKAR